MPGHRAEPAHCGCTTACAGWGRGVYSLTQHTWGCLQTTLLGLEPGASETRGPEWSLGQGMANFFGKRPNSKYFGLFTFCVFVLTTL